MKFPESRNILLTCGLWLAAGGVARAADIDPAFDELLTVAPENDSDEVRANLPAASLPDDGSEEAPLASAVQLPPATAKAARKRSATAYVPSGTISLDRGAMAHAVSGLGDPSRVLQFLPGVGRSTDWETTLLVRGGDPDQTVFLVDGVTLPRVNHFEGMKNDHGGVGLLNLEFVESMEFHRGVLPARMPDRLSGVVDMRFRDGDTAAFQSRVVADLTGAGGKVEGPLPGSRGGSYAATFRYSTLDLLVRQGLVEAFGVPQYYNGQMRAYVPGERSALRLDVVGGEESWSNAIGRSAALDAAGHTLSAGLDWQTRANGRWTRLAGHYQDLGQTVGFRSLMAPNRSGKDSLSHEEEGRETRYGAAVDHSFQLGEAVLVRVGGEEELLRRSYSESIGDQEIFIPEADTTLTLTSAHSMASRDRGEAAGYAEATWSPGPWEIYAGYRHFYEEMSDQHGFGPRLGIKARPAGAHQLGLAAGLQTQAHDYLDIGRREHPHDARLPYMGQADASWDWKITPATAFSLEGFAKEGFRLARTTMELRGSRIVSVGKDTGRTRDFGFEAYLRRGRAGRLAYSVAYTFLHHRERAADGSWTRTSASIPHSFNGSVEIEAARGLFLSCRYSTASGTPYIPFDRAASRRAATGVYDEANAYTVTEAPFQRLDARVGFERHLGHMFVDAFLEVENVLDRRNAFERRWNPVDGKVAVMEGMGRLPVAGLALGF